MTDLGGLGTDSQGNSLGAFVEGINASGQVVGSATVSIDNGNGQTSHAFIDIGGVMTDLGLGDSSLAFGINNAGQVIGEGIFFGFFIDTGGVLTILSKLPKGINNNGDVVGDVRQTGDTGVE